MKHVKIELGDTLEISGHVFMVTGYEFDGGSLRRGQLMTGYVEKIEPERIPFDLEAAKAGAPLVTRDGRKARFVAHVPEAGAGCRVLAIVDGNGFVTDFAENGLFEVGYEDDIDLFMAPKTKRTVYINVRPGPNYGRGPAEWFDCEAAAKAAARQFPGCIAAVAEIEA